jgi:hypothetical protein
MTMFKKENDDTAPEVLTDEQLELVSGGDAGSLGAATVIHQPIGPIGPRRPVLNPPPVRGLPPPL